jgi:hypothetical protein
MSDLAQDADQMVTRPVVGYLLHTAVVVAVVVVVVVAAAAAATVVVYCMVCGVVRHLLEQNTMLCMVWWMSVWWMNS